MRIILIGFLACALFSAVASWRAGAQELPHFEDALPGHLLVPHVPPSQDSDKEIAGLSKGSRPEVLTWDRVYALALVRARSRRGAFSESLDPAALAGEAARQGVANFERFRSDFLAGGLGAGGRPFRDPSAAVLELLGRLQAIDNARRNVPVHEGLDKLLHERAQGESSGLNRLDVDMVGASLARARQRQADEIRQFRDGLDELKVALGLSPRAAVILDRQSLAAFRAVFDSVDAWNRNSQRNLEELHRLVERLPALGEVVLDGQPILAKIENSPDQWEDVLTAAARLAIKHRADRDIGRAPGDSGARLELSVRRRIRNSFEMGRAYVREKRSYELAIRMRDQAFERLLAPSVGVTTSRSPLLEGLIEQVTRVLTVEDRLAALWTSFRTERLALYRDLGVLPHNDWNSFYADLSAGPVAAKAVPTVPPKPRVTKTAPQAPAPAAPPGR
ncbi:MAG: hypothetical protein ACHRXM_32940 [Isosphaerales bacterium]